MAKIDVTRREFHGAWRAHKLLWHSATVQSNAALTCLFYAIECGLKAAILKQQSREVSGAKEGELGHDINKMLSELRVDASLLIDQYQLSDLKNPDRPRNIDSSQINQAFRYGIKFKDEPKKAELVNKLTSIAKWIEGELR